MNIFVTNNDPQICAHELCDHHLRKQIVETAQMLSTAHRVLDGDEYADKAGLYKETHKNHPCAVWVRETWDTYNWTFALFAEYLFEYENRFCKEHACARLFYPLDIEPEALDETYDQRIIPEHPLCMPDEFKTSNVYESYQAYLRHKRLTWATRIDKKQIEMTWTNRDEPKWMKGWDDDYAKCPKCGHGFYFGRYEMMYNDPTCPKCKYGE